MKTLLKSFAFAALLLAGSASVVQAKSAPAAAAPTAKSAIAVANLNGVIGNSAAFKAAQSQRSVTYQAQISSAETRRTAIIAQLQPLADKLQRDAAAPNANQAALAQQQQTIQQLQDAGTRELQGILRPVSLSDAYVLEQIQDKLGAAVQAAMAKNGVSLLLKAEAVQVVTNAAYDLTPEVLAELNTALPTVQLVPPAGWLPREQREQQAGQADNRGTATGGR